MPVSRKRKKKPSSGRRSPGRSTGPTPSRASEARAIDDVLAYRSKLAEHRTALAKVVAGPMVDALVAAAAGCSDDDLEDDFCARYGAAMVGFEGGAVEDSVNPENLVRALLSTLDERLHAAGEDGAEVAALRRLLIVVAGVLPSPLSVAGRDLVAAHVDAGAARRVADGRAVTGPVMWARDAYGSRRAVVAPFASAAGPDRWYLWDVDACGLEPVVVHSGFHPSAESAMLAWQTAVGQAAAGAATLRPVNDAETFEALVRGEIETIRLGGEDLAQHAEFLRNRRLGETVRKAVGGQRAQAQVRLTAADAAEQFAQRLRRLGHHDRVVDDPQDDAPPGADDLAVDLAETWTPRHQPTLYPYCSPHKVAEVVLLLRDLYHDDYAAALGAVLPEWIRFLAEYTDTPAELTERCLAYASGDVQFPALLDDHGQSHIMIRVTE